MGSRCDCFLINSDAAPATVGRVCDQQEATVLTHGKALRHWSYPPCEPGDLPLVTNPWVLRRATKVNILAIVGR